MMEWRIRETKRGAYAEYGAKHEGGEELGYISGHTMPCFIVYYSAHFDTKRQAQGHIKKHPNPLLR